MNFGFGSNNRDRLDRISAIPENNRIESERLKTNSERIPPKKARSGLTSARILSLTGNEEIGRASCRERV